ncbi:MAG: immune inhibitor A, partial [Firmicutes bacterium]|nr:immune inhibitor A [Bacillota bacterium]
MCWEFPLPDGGLALSFEGQAEVRLVPTEVPSGRWMWWSNRGDQGHSALERTLDLRGVSGATLSYKVWFDLEEGWDYAYVRASADDGKTWIFLRTPAMREAGSSGYALGPGYTGASGGWIAEEVSLDQFAGQVIRLRFDYLTDDAVHRAGLCLDDFRLEATGWADDVETGEGDWRPEGFLRIENRLPQRYLVQTARRGE